MISQKSKENYFLIVVIRKHVKQRSYMNIDFFFKITFVWFVVDQVYTQIYNQWFM
jgi:hypothetical protein